MNTNKIIFNSITIKYGLEKKCINFSKKNNLIYSKDNSVGKSSLLRLLIYSLGYDVPSTKMIKFANLELELNIECINGDVTIIRRDKYLKLNNNNTNEEFIYNLPSDLNNILSYIYNTDNINIINNILGSFYFEQEHGWTLLNRGKVSGKIGFNIESLVRGLSNIDCSKLIKELSIIQNKIQKYKYIENVSDYQKIVMDSNNILTYNNYDEEQDSKLYLLKIKSENLKLELKELNNILKHNNSFKNYINSYKLRVKNENGVEIPVNENTIIGYEDNNQFIKNKIRILSQEISGINKQINSLEKKISNDLISEDTDTILVGFDKKISDIKINQKLVKETITFLEKKQKEISAEISRKTKLSNETIKSLYDIILKYSIDLNVEEYINKNVDFIFTSDLKSLSGAILHKIVFIFKLAYIKVIKEYTGIILPIVLDSPNGRETNQDNVKEMVKILNEDYKEHQIIIASIFENYEIDNLKKIEIEKKLMENNEFTSF